MIMTRAFLSAVCVLFAIICLSQIASAKTEKAVLAAGCFWGVEESFRKLPGVTATRVGYSGGTSTNPKYEQVSEGTTGHAESVEIEFDPAKTSYEKLLEHFFKMHDPTTLNRQGNDVGTQYRSAIFPQSNEQRKTAEAFKARVDKSKAWKAPVTTKIESTKAFYPAEEEHQDYLQRNKNGYDNHFIRNVTF